MFEQFMWTIIIIIAMPVLAFVLGYVNAHKLIKFHIGNLYSTRPMSNQQIDALAKELHEIKQGYIAAGVEYVENSIKADVVLKINAELKELKKDYVAKGISLTNY
jgi:hypothetical protein